MLHKLTKEGFTLLEVLTAVLIMAMMMVAVVSFIDYTSTIWRTGQEAVSNKNYSRLAFDFIQKELLNASEIKYPKNYNTDNTLAYKVSGNNEKPYHCIYYRSNETGELMLVISDKELSGPYPQSDAKYKHILLARNIDDFKFKRISTSAFEINIVVRANEKNDEDEYDIVSSDTMILYAPMIRQL